MAADIDISLETGWLPDTPIGDTMLRRFVHNQADVNAIIARASDGKAERHDRVFLADPGSPVPYLNQAILATPLQDAEDPVLDIIEQFFGGRERPATVLSIWPTPDLTVRGWSLVGHPVFVVRAPGPISHRRPEGVDVRPAKAASDYSTAERILIDGYPLEEAKATPPGTVLPASVAGSGLELLLGLLDGKAVAAGEVFVSHGVANLCMAATLASARRRGVWEALVWARVAMAPDLPAVAFTSDMSRPGFVRMGFLPITRFALWCRPG